MAGRSPDFQFGRFSGRGWRGVVALAIVCSTFAFVAWQIPAVGIASVAAFRRWWIAP